MKKKSTTSEFHPEVGMGLPLLLGQIGIPQPSFRLLRMVKGLSFRRMMQLGQIRMAFLNLRLMNSPLIQMVPFILLP